MVQLSCSFYPAITNSGLCLGVIVVPPVPVPVPAGRSSGFPSYRSQPNQEVAVFLINEYLSIKIHSQFRTNSLVKDSSNRKMTSKHFPVANGMLPFWRTDPHSLDNHRSSESLPEESDIVIVGAGYAGASVAHHILEQTPAGSKAPSITIIEARQACSGATARNGKFILTCW